MPYFSQSVMNSCFELCGFGFVDDSGGVHCAISKEEKGTPLLLEECLACWCDRVFAWAVAMTVFEVVDPAFAVVAWAWSL